MTKHELIQSLKEIRSIATMKNANFRIGQKPGPFGAECTDLVRVATELWRESWIINPLDEIIKDLETAESNNN